MKKALLLTIMMLGYMVSQAQINKYGIPFITNYTKDVIGCGDETWDAVQDSRGMLYFANQNGVFEYDGHYWKRIQVNNMSVKSLSVDGKGVVHVGVQNDFGRLLPNEKGELEFVSSRINLPDSLTFGETYHIYHIGDDTYYCGLDYIVVERDGVVKPIRFPFKNGFLSFPIGDSILISKSNAGMSVLYNDTITNYIDGSYEGICGLEPLTSEKYFFIGSNTVRILNTSLRKCEKVDNIILNDLCADATNPYSLKKFDEDFVLTFISGCSIAIADNTLQVNNVINQQYGLANGQVTNSMQTDNLLWATTINGVSKIELGSAFSKFSSSMGLNGLVNDVIEYNGCIYIATIDGIYYIDEQNGFTSIKTYEENLTSYSFAKVVSPIDNTTKLMVCTSTGIYEIENNAKKIIYGKDATVFFQSKTHPEYIYLASLGNGIEKLEYDKKSNKWNPKPMSIKGLVNSIEEDNNGNIWFSLNCESLVKYSQDDSEYTFYDEKSDSGLSSVYQINIKNINDTLLFCAEDGIYEFDQKTSKFVLSDILGAEGQDSTHSYYDIVSYDGGYAVLNYIEDEGKYWVSIINKNNGKFYKLEAPFNRLPNSQMEFAYSDSKGNLWLPMGEDLYCYRSSKIDKKHPYYENNFDAHVRSVIVNDSILLFGGAYLTVDGGIAKKQGEKDIPVLDYKNNSLLFQYSATFFEEEDKLVYSTMLEGADDTWSKYKPGNEYARYALREGSYTFKVKAKNIYGVESSVAEYSFVIKPPFYRTALAYIFYVIALIAGVFGIVKWNTHRLIEDKKKLERKIAEATEEIRGQNVQLEQQKDEIEKQKDEIQASINYARRIQRALLTPDETIDAIFPDHFLLYKPRNIVSGDYYWIGQFGDNKVCIVADCTGHGVPGGFMSMLGMTNLNYIVGQELRPDEILNKLRKAIITSLRQKDESIVAQMAENGDAPVVVEKKDRSQDGMDVAMYVINEKEMTLSFAGANNPLVLIRDGEVQVIKASKMPVGIYAKLDPFERVDMELKKGDCLYTFSDGFQDQFGQATGRKFMSKHLREVLLENHQKPMAEQKEILNKTYEDWRGPADLQTDDVVLMGVRI